MRTPSLWSFCLGFFVCAPLGQAEAQSWVSTSAPITNWTSIACSADGTKVAAAGGGSVFFSTNSGQTWAEKSAPTGPWVAVTSSADGNTLVAAQDDDYVQLAIYASTNAGADWTLAHDLGYTRGLGCSADGSKVVRVESPRASHSANVGNIFTSMDSGINWSGSSAPLLRWQAVASSADGSRLVAGTFGGDTGGGPIYASTNNGATWQPTPAPANYWLSLAGSTDGRRLVAGAHYGAGGSASPGLLYVSADAGLTWQSSSPTAYWSGVASSADGTKLVAVAGAYPPQDDFTGAIYSSEDSGLTWKSNAAPVTRWTSVASSADGSTRFAAVSSGGIYTWQNTPTPLVNMIASGNDLLFSWTVPSMSFVLQQASNLTSAKWAAVPVAPTLNYTNLRYELSVPRPLGTMFYRLASQ